MTTAADEKIERIKKMYRDDVKNIPFPPLKAAPAEKLHSLASPGLGALLTRLKTAVAVSLEYEHKLVLVYGKKGRVYTHSLDIPHPSGLWWDGESLVVTSTRSPNQIVYFRALPTDFESEVLPPILPSLRAEQSRARTSRLDSPLLVPVKSFFLPGNFSTHDLVKMGRDLYLTATGLNFLARVSPQGGFERVWHPKCLDPLGPKAFQTNYLQLNSIAKGRTLKDCFFTAFSDQPTQAKPWKAGYGPKNKGVVFAGSTRETIYRGLTCPHSIRRFGGKLWLCDSGMGELGTLDPKRGRYTCVTKLPGFTRGLAFLEGYAMVGLSKVIPTYEPYAPGLDSRKSQCGLAFVNLKTGAVEGTLIWKQGFQVYDVQVMTGLDRAILPENSSEDSMNYYLTYYGWDLKWNHRKKN